MHLKRKNNPLFGVLNRTLVIVSSQNSPLGLRLKNPRSPQDFLNAYCVVYHGMRQVYLNLRISELHWKLYHFYIQMTRTVSLKALLRL